MDMRHFNRFLLILFMFTCLNLGVFAQRRFEAKQISNDQSVSKGKLTSYLLPFNDTCSRQVAIWVPDNFDPSRSYATIYMHDGQMLFDAKVTWNKKEWRVDETCDSLMSNNITRPFIVVGIYNDPTNRYAEFFPQGAVAYMDTAYTNQLLNTLWNGALRADYYIHWITHDLIPFVEDQYPVSHKREDRFLIGSSMGGLISLYGLTEKPNTFGGAACLSIHTPMINFQLMGDDAMNAMVLPYNQYLKNELPSPRKVKLYIDRGTETLDAYYGPYHEVLLKTLGNKGYELGPNYLTLICQKTAHDEVSWANRLAIPMKFLLINDPAVKRPSKHFYKFVKGPF